MLEEGEEEDQENYDEDGGAAANDPYGDENAQEDDGQRFVDEYGNEIPQEEVEAYMRA